MGENRELIRDNRVAIDNVYCADFETTSSPNLEKDGCVRVYIWSLIRVSDRKKWFGYNLDSFLARIRAVKAKICYFHNLKFDGNFILYRLLELNEPLELCAPNGSWFYLKWKGIEFRDSLKKIKLSVAQIAMLLNIPHKIDVRDDNGKFPWEYYIPESYIAPMEQVEYCLRDSEIIAEFISREWKDGRTRLTTSAEAYHNAKNSIPKFRLLFPKIEPEIDEFVRQSYKGGVCALNEKFANCDIDSIYG